MNVGIGAEAVQFPEQEFINSIFVATYASSGSHKDRHPAELVEHPSCNRGRGAASLVAC